MSHSSNKNEYVHASRANKSHACSFSMVGNGNKQSSIVRLQLAIDLAALSRHLGEVFMPAGKTLQELRTA